MQRNDEGAVGVVREDVFAETLLDVQMEMVGMSPVIPSISVSARLQVFLGGW